MNTMAKLCFLLDGRAAPWRCRLAASAVLARVISRHVPPGELSLRLIALRETLKRPEPNNPGPL